MMTTASETHLAAMSYAALAATHPQSGYHCAHCGTEMNNYSRPPAVYAHAADCLWLRAREATKEQA